MPPEISRRDFLQLAGAASVALSAAACAAAPAPVAAAGSGEASAFEHECDVVVVGTGAAGATAALYAQAGGAQVIVLEKAPLFGGTTAKSGGVYWIPNHPIERERGLKEPRDATLQAMCHASYPLLFDPVKPHYGLAQNDYELIETFYDRGADAVVGLEKMGALVSMPADVLVGPMPDYIEPPGAAKIVDRRYWAKKADGSFGLGDEMVRQLRAALDAKKIPILLGHRAQRALVNPRGDVVGLEVQGKAAAPLRVRARRGVVFASGGFTHDDELVRNFQPGPIFGGCAVPTNQGDFVRIAESLGARLGHMQSAWRAQVVLEQALQFSSTPDDVFMPPGDSMILVNRFGRRVVDEKANYNERTRVHFAWDPVRHEWANLLLFMVYDQRTAELFGGRFPLPAAGTSAPYVQQGRELAGAREGARRAARAGRRAHRRSATRAGLRRAARPDHFPLRRLREERRRPGVPARRSRLRPRLAREDLVLRQSGHEARASDEERDDASVRREGAVLRDRARGGHARHERRAGDRPASARARRGRQADRRPVRRRQLHRLADRAVVLRAAAARSARPSPSGVSPARRRRRSP